MLPRQPSPSGNRLLDALPASDRRRLVERCTSIELRRSSLLSRHGRRMPYVYFPLSCIASVTSSDLASPAVEVAIVGNEGMIGLAAGLGGQDSGGSHVNGPGRALRIGEASFLEQMARSAALRTTMQRYVLVRLTQLAQAVACNRFHAVEPRLARWLLSMRDRGGSDTVATTHAHLSTALGARRAGISEAASALRHAGLITYVRGDVQIVDAAGLEALACGCYRIDIATYVRGFGKARRRVRAPPRAPRRHRAHRQSVSR